MTDASKNSHKEKADDQAEAKAAEEGNQKAGSGKGFGLSNFLIFAFGSIGLVFIGIAINYHTKGGYDSTKLALLWGIIGYGLFGVGLYFAYYEYVVKPVRAAERARQTADAKEESVTANASAAIPVERPDVFLEHAEMEPLKTGQRASARLVIRNAGKVNAYQLRIRTALSYVNSVGPAPLVDYFAPNIVMPEPFQFDVLPAQERLGLNPKSEQPLSKKDIKEVNARSRLLVLTGLGEYEDINGTGYSFAYCLMYHSDAAPSFVIHCPGKYWPRDSRGRAEASPEKRAWLIADRIEIDGLKAEDSFWVFATMQNVGELPAIIKDTKLTGDFLGERKSYSDQMTWADINDAEVVKPSGPTPVSAMGPGQKIVLPIQAGPISKELFKAITEGSVYLYAVGGVEYETRGAIHHTVFCVVYEPTLKKFVVCGGGMD